MYNIFGINSSKTNFCYLEGEPPPKKLISDADIFIKQLSDKQLEKTTSLAEQLSVHKEFKKSIEFNYLSKLNGGAVSLEKFQYDVEESNKINKLKSYGLTDFEIVLFNEYTARGEDFVKSKYKNLNEEILHNYIVKIQEIRNKHDECAVESKAVLPRNHMEFIERMKPDSVETKLLKFAIENQACDKEIFRKPIDEIKEIEQKFVDDLKSFEPVNIKKIRRKARSLQKKIDNLDVSIINNDQKHNSVGNSSKWDVKEIKNDKEKPKKVYECKNQQLYTIKDGQIVKINKTFKEERKKLTIDEIKLIPKFTNYDPGECSNVLYLKNLVSSVKEEDLKSVLNYPNEIKSIKIMNGRMKGQAFIEFRDETSASEALNTLNGLYLKNKPIIAQYGKKKTQS